MKETQPVTRRYVPIQRAFNEIGVGRTRGYRLIAEGLIRAVKLGRKTYVDWQSVEAMFDGLPELIPTSRLRVLTAGDLGFGEPEDPQAFAITEQDLLATPKPLAMDGPEAA